MTEEENKPEEEFADDSDALTLDDLATGYISNPKVGGEPVVFVVKKITKMVGKALIGKDRNGEAFSKNLSNVDFGYEVITKDETKYTVSSWEVFGKIKNIFHKLNNIEGVKLEITHLLDGMKAENKKKDKYKVAAEVDGVFKTLDRKTQDWAK
ncbi:hypothetical protein HN865_02295 [Candidatus Woesearchaeota archaeon]|jgi:hypothetical protein|nr:hypothetical protein [archaeon]MBT7237664.1 hypothetical protein [Candidatus Woesearchaeota archaeon]